MANDVNLDLDPYGLLYIIPERSGKFEEAPDTPLPADYPANSLSRAIHPALQKVTIAGIKGRGQDAKSYILVAAKNNGTEALAYFNAGQYLSVSVEIDGAIVSKPYSLCSSPADALTGNYTITVKRSENGFVSDYILNNWKIGDIITVSGPQGSFTYEPLRDARHVVGLAGGSGITPFYSLACAIADGTEDFELTLLYGSRTSDSILLKEDFDALEAKCSKIKVIHVLSDEQAEGYETGFLTAELIGKYAPAGDYSLFVCGPQVMYDFVDREIEKLGLPLRRVRHELFGEYKNPEKNADYPQEAVGKSFKLTVCIRDEVYEVGCAAGETLLVAMERAKIAAPSRCRSGECGYCHSWLKSGVVYVPEDADGRRSADAKFGYIHPCCSFPLSDVAIDVPRKPQ